MKKFFTLIQLVIIATILNAQEILDIQGKQEVRIVPLKNNEEFIFKKVPTTERFELDLIGRTKSGKERFLGKIAHFTAYQKLCENDTFFFSIDNYFKKDENILDELFVLNIKEGKINKVLDAHAFDASNDGRYICYCEPWQISVKENHEVDYWYIYDVITEKQKVIINTKQENDWQINLRAFDEKTNSFIFELGYDATVLKTISFNPYEILP